MTTGSPIKVVIFDFGGVICFPPNEAQWREAAEFCAVDRHKFEAAFWEDRDRYDRGQEPREYWSAIGARLGLNFNDAIIDAMIQREIAFWSHFDDRVLGWAKDLQRAGIRTGILSNLPRPIGERLKSIPGFLGHFDEVTFSYEVGSVKPEPAIYESSVQGLKIGPGEALFIDDRAANIEGARAVGLNTTLYTTWEDFLTDEVSRKQLPPPSP